MHWNIIKKEQIIISIYNINPFIEKKKRKYIELNKK